MAIGLEAATLVSIFVEAVLFGLFLSLFLLTNSVIWSRYGDSPSTRNINMKLLCVLVVMFVLATTHLGASLSRIIFAFIKRPTLTAETLSAVDTSMYILRMIVYGIQTLIGDAFILYRLYLVWNGKRAVFYPLCSAFIGSIGTAIGALQSVARPHSHLVAGSPAIVALKQSPWVITFFALTLLTNAVSTVLIAGRIWWVPLGVTQMSTGGSQSLGRTSIAIMESGAVYTVSLVLLMVLYVKHSYAQNIILDSMTQIIGISFSLVIVRVALGLARAGAIKPESMEQERLNLTVKSMLDRRNAAAAPMGSRTDQYDSESEANVIACQVEVVQDCVDGSIDISSEPDNIYDGGTKRFSSSIISHVSQK